MTSCRIRSKARATVVASLFSLATAAPAAVVCNSASPLPYTVPATSAGVYMNLVTGTFGTTPAAVPGWDFNPWGSTNLTFFFPSTPATSHGAVSTGTDYSILASGEAIGPASTFATTGQTYALWRAGSTGQYLGVRFYNEATSAINYGWIRLDTTAATGHPAVIQNYCYDNTGAQIPAGTLPVELQTFTVE
jgi:hypothetical protein